MKNILKVFILTFIIGLSSCAGFYVKDNIRYVDDYTYHNKYSIFNPYYQPYHTVTVIKPINYGHWNWNNNTSHHHHHKHNNNNNQHYGHRKK